MVKKVTCLATLLWATTAVALAMTSLKPAAQLVVLGLFVILGGLLGLFRQKAWSRYLSAVLVALTLLGASLVSFFQLSLWLYPSVRPDGYAVMPIGQTFVGIALGFGFCVLMSWLYFARLKPDPRLEAIWVYATFVVLGAAFALDWFL